MIRRVPVLRHHHVLKPRCDSVNYLNNRIPTRNRKGAARAKVILHVNHYQNVMRIRLHRVSCGQHSNRTFILSKFVQSASGQQNFHAIRPQ
jgi:hypothetical protein